MKICNGKIDLDKYLCEIPFDWREDIINAIIAIEAGNNNSSNCENIQNCQTVTSLSPFTLVGTILTIKYTDENGTVKTSTIDISPIIEDSLDNIDPKCIATEEEWAEMTNKERLQAIFNRSCCIFNNDIVEGCCECEPNCIDCNFDCSCVAYYLTAETVPYDLTYKDCETKGFETIEVTESLHYQCAIRNSLVLPLDVTYFEVEECGISTTTTSTTTTTTAAPTTTTTTSSTTTTSTEATTTTTTTSTSTTSTSTTSTTSSTTTTTTEAWAYYPANEHRCSDCIITQTDILVRIPSSQTVEPGKHHLPVGHPTGFVYNVTSASQQAPGAAIDIISTNFTTCGGACI